MKKFLSLLLCLVILGSVIIMSSCDALDTLTSIVENSGIKDAIVKKSPEKLYAETIEKIDDLENFTLTSKQEITMTYNNETQIMNQTVIIKKNYEDEYIRMHNDTIPEINLEGWYISEVFYAEMYGLRFKARIDYDDYVEKYMPDGDDGALLDIPKDWFKDIDLERDDEGMYYLKFVITGDNFKEYMDDIGITDDLTEANVGYVSYKVYFDRDGNLGETITEFNMDMNGMFASYKIVSTLSEIGSTAITLPDGADAWQDMTGSV